MNRAIIYPFYPNLQNPNYVTNCHFPEFFSKPECEKIKSSMIGGFRAKIEGKGSEREAPEVRGTTIYGLEPTQDNKWIFDKLREPILKANFDLWAFELSGFCEGLQVSKYNLGDHYDWHMDIGKNILSQRKLSIVAQLSNPADYEGGELEFFKEGDAPKEQGTLILFPSYMQHRVRKITKGTRYSLVAWISGVPYR